jgi:hypothetical protein
VLFFYERTSATHRAEANRTAREEANGRADACEQRCGGEIAAGGFVDDGGFASAAAQPEVFLSLLSRRYWLASTSRQSNLLSIAMPTKPMDF